jgi:hypothetical protein
MAIKLGNNSINKAYIGNGEIKKMYLGNDIVFDNSVRPFIIEVNLPSGVGSTSSFQFTGAVGDYDVVAKQSGSIVQTFNNLSDESTINLSNGGGVYILEVKPKASNGFTGLRFNNTGDRLKLIEIKQWGSFNDSRQSLFFGCDNLTQIGSDNNWLNSITNGLRMFNSCSLTSLPSTLTLENLENGLGMFPNSELTALPSGMNLPSLTDGTSMFNNNLLTSLPSGMNLSSLTVGDNMFSSNSITDLPSLMVLSSLTNGTSMFTGSTINTTRFSQLYEDMEANNSNNNVPFHGGNSEYNTDGKTAKDLLIADHSWTFTDGGLE